MAEVVAVHGIGQQRKGPNELHNSWFPALLDGLHLAGFHIDGLRLACAFYGDLFRPPGHSMATLDPPYEAEDVDDPFELSLLDAWWTEAARVDSRVVAPQDQSMARTARRLQRVLMALSQSRFWTNVGERALIGDLKQVRSYFCDISVRGEARDRVADVVSSDTRVLIGHSLGSVVAYEELCANPHWPVRAFVTLGSPLGIRGLIFNRLEPSPSPDGFGAWPGTITHWTNVADTGDVVALVKDLRPHFGQRVESFIVDNGATAHDVGPYLTAKETGRAVAKGLAST